MLTSFEVASTLTSENLKLLSIQTFGNIQIRYFKKLCGIINESTVNRDKNMGLYDL